MKKGKKGREKHLRRIDSILKGLIDYKTDKAEYERIQEKYSKVNAQFTWTAFAGGYAGPQG